MNRDLRSAEFNSNFPFWWCGSDVPSSCHDLQAHQSTLLSFSDPVYLRLSWLGFSKANMDF